MNCDVLSRNCVGGVGNVSMKFDQYGFWKCEEGSRIGEVGYVEYEV